MIKALRCGLGTTAQRLGRVLGCTTGAFKCRGWQHHGVSVSFRAKKTVSAWDKKKGSILTKSQSPRENLPTIQTKTSGLNFNILSIPKKWTVTTENKNQRNKKQRNVAPGLVSVDLRDSVWG